MTSHHNTIHHITHLNSTHHTIQHNTTHKTKQNNITVSYLTLTIVSCEPIIPLSPRLLWHLFSFLHLLHFPISLTVHLLSICPISHCTINSVSPLFPVVFFYLHASGLVRNLLPRAAMGLSVPLLAPLWSASFSFR